MLDLRQSRNYAKYIKSIGWKVDSIEKSYCYTKKILAIGSIIKIQRPSEKIKVEKIDKLAKKRKAIFVYIEPSNVKQLDYYIKNGFSKIKSPSLPSKTVQINLLKDKEKLLNNMNKKTRYSIRNAVKKGVVVLSSSDIEEFSNFWQISAKKRGSLISQKKEIKNIFHSFGKNARIFFAKRQNKLLGGVLIVNSKEISYYMYAASNKIGNKLLAPTLLVWEAILYSKKKGMSIFDFEGIYDDRFPLKSWIGFSRFKKSFGGDEVMFPAPLRKFYFPF